MTSPAPVTRSAQDLKVLVVDDIATMRNHEQRMLAEMGIRQVTQACDGREACNMIYAGGKSFDLILADINMPNMNGIDLLRAIRQTDTSTPVIMVTAEARKEDILRAAQLGADAYVIKPFTGPTLREKVETVFAKRGVTLTGLEPAPPAPHTAFAHIRKPGWLDRIKSGLKQLGL